MVSVSRTRCVRFSEMGRGVFVLAACARFWRRLGAVHLGAQAVRCMELNGADALTGTRRGRLNCLGFQPSTSATSIRRWATSTIFKPLSIAVLRRRA